MATITFEFTGPQATATIAATQAALTTLNGNHRIRRGDVGGEGVPTFKGRQSGGGPPVAGPPPGTTGLRNRTARQGTTGVGDGTDGRGTRARTGTGEKLNRTLPADAQQKPNTNNLKATTPSLDGDAPTKLSTATPPGGKPPTGSLLADTPETPATGKVGGVSPDATRKLDGLAGDALGRLQSPTGGTTGRVTGPSGADRDRSGEVPDFGDTTRRLDALAGQGEDGLGIGRDGPGTGSLDLDQAAFDRLGNLASDGATRLSGVGDGGPGGSGGGTAGITLPPANLTGGGLGAPGTVRVPSLGTGPDGQFGGGGIGGGGGAGGGLGGISVPTGSLTTGGLGGTGLGAGGGSSLLSGGVGGVSGPSGTGTATGGNLGAAAFGRAGAAGVSGGGATGALGSTGAPMAPMGGMGGMGGAHQQGKQDNQNQSQTWLTEDDDVWGGDDCHPGQLGRE